MSLSLFFDGSCPVCVREMNQLKNWDTNKELRLVDATNHQAMEVFPYIDSANSMRILHAETAEGELLLGLDANIASWNAVKRKPLLGILRWPIIRYSRSGLPVFCPLPLSDIQDSQSEIQV